MLTGGVEAIDQNFHHLALSVVHVHYYIVSVRSL